MSGCCLDGPSVFGRVLSHAIHKPSYIILLQNLCSLCFSYQVMLDYWLCLSLSLMVVPVLAVLCVSLTGLGISQ